MSLPFNKLWATLLMGASATAFVACGKAAKTTSTVQNLETFDPRPADTATLEAQLKRFKGQTSFLTPYQTFWRGMPYAAAEAAPGRTQAGEVRKIQESDIYKIGPKGSKLLYLLNNYRGLQVVSFADGADSPKLVGRVDATGNWPNDMYYDEANQRLVVLENLWYDEEKDSYDYSDSQSRLVVYDVKDASKPRIAQVVPIKGSLSESRMVGDVLYVATSVRPSWQDRQSGKKGEGYVQSFALDQGDVTLVEQTTFSAPVAYGENMNVLDVVEGGKHKYYAVAILSKDAWSWWDRQSIVEVVDISDPKGHIKPLMVATAKGRVSERSQTHIADGTLIVTSNYTPKDSTLARVAVESFVFPGANAEVLTPEEAEYRRLYVERAVAKKKKELEAQGVTGDALVKAIDDYRDQLLADKELGLKGRFVKDADAKSPRKPYADSMVSVGSTQNLSASLQDVRYQDGLLYAFWVPANNIDPLDVFDISKPREGVRHLNHLEFEGWIQRAIPVTYGGKNYILGLGWIIPSVNNEHNLRFPQAALFEVKRTQRGSVRAELVAQKNLQGSHTWANFNAQDKMIETRFDADGKGTIMYTFSSWESNRYMNGGKLVSFDLAKAATDPEGVFGEGGVLKGDDNWLRRMFSNPEVNRVNGFADTALSTYQIPATFTTANAIIEASNILELARNLAGFVTLGQGQNARGLQLVSAQSWWSETGKSQLRLVPLTNADAELPKVLATVDVEGSIVDYVKAGDDSLVILSQLYRRIPATDANHADTYKYYYYVTRVKVQGNALALAGHQSWEYGTAQSTAPRLGYLQKLIRLKDGTIIAAAGGSVKKLAGEGTSFTATDLTTQNCEVSASESAQLHDLNGRLVLSVSKAVNDPNRAGLRYSRNSISLARVEGDKLACDAAVNIPGRIMQILGESQIITEDTRLIDAVPRQSGDRTYYEVVTETSLDSLTLTKRGERNVAVLKDLYDPKNVALNTVKLLGDDKLIFVESNVKPYYRGRFLLPDVWRPIPGWNRTENRLSILGFDKDGTFTKTSYVLDLKTSQASASVASVIDAGQGKKLVAISHGRKLNVLALQADRRPEALKLRKFDAAGQPGEAREDVVLPGGYWYWSSELGAISFDAALKRLFVPQGLNGLTTLGVEI